MSEVLKAGAATTDISPVDSQFLVGYPHVKRFSEGIHDPLMSSVLYLNDGRESVMFIANDILYFNKQTIASLRKKISGQTGMAENHIMITATHTHSGPITSATIGLEMKDSFVSGPDLAYLELLERKIVQAAIKAVESSVPAELGLVTADGTGVGCNRRDPSGACNQTVPVLAVREQDGARQIAIMMAYSMHPTVLHENSKLVSADFPGMTRAYLQANVADCPIVYHTSPAGNQSPRHKTRENTFAEAKRLGEILGKSVEKMLQTAEYRRDIQLRVQQTFVELPVNDFLSVPEAEKLEAAAKNKLERMRNDGSPRQEVRTAECDWFGAERKLLLSRLKENGILAKEIAKRQPAEIQVITVGPWRFASWPGEIFVEYALEIMQRFKDTYVFAYTNGETQGYLVTPEAVAEGGYEASTAIFKSPDSPEKLVEETSRLLTE